MISDSRRTLVALIAAIVISEIEMLIIPLILSGISDIYQLDDGLAGLITACHTGAFAFTTLVLAPYVNKLNRKVIGFLGVAMIVLGSLGTLAGVSIAALALCRILAGAGEGILAAIAFSGAAESPSPHRTFSLMYFFAIASSIVGFFGVSFITATFGAEWMFAYVAAIAILGLPLVLGIPSAARKEDHQESRIRDVISLPSVITLLAYLMFMVGVLAIWFYIEKIGRQLGLSIETIGQLLGIAAILSLLGPVLSNWYGTRRGRLFPLTAGYVLCGVGCLVISRTDSSVVYFLNIVMVNIVLMFTAPYIMSLLAEQDRAGRLTVAGRGIGAVANFLAPVLAGGLLLLDLGYQSVGWLAFVILLTGIVMLLPVVRKSENTRALKTTL